MTQQDTQPPAETLADREGIFADWSTQTLADQCHMQAREQLDPEFSQFMTACGNRLAALTRRAGGDAIMTAALNQNDAMRQELAHVGNLVSDLARALKVDQANDDGTWPDLAGRIQRLIAATPKPPAGGDAGDGWIVKLDNWMTVSVEDGGLILRNEAGEPIAFGKLGPNADFPAGAAHEPFGHWVEQKHADPVLLRKPSYIPEPSDLRTVTPLYSAALALPAPVVEGERVPIRYAADMLDQYAAFIREEVKADDLERHPYLPLIEDVAAQLRAALSEGRSHG